MDAHQAEERTGVFAVLSALTLGATILLLVLRAHLLVSGWVLAAIVVPWVAFSAFLRTHRDTWWGTERKYLDLWSIPHVIGGALFGVFGIGFVWVLAVTVWWECVESISRVYEHPTNRVTDVIIAVVGWGFAQAILTGTLHFM
jgi:hypothetical protein